MFGCEVVLSHQDREGHEEKCGFRLTPCVHINCKESILPTNFKSHLEDHKTTIKTSAFGTFEPFTAFDSSDSKNILDRARTNLKLNTQQYIALSIEGHLFVFNLLLNSGVWHFWLWIDSTSEEAKKFE